ncbi:plasma membrane ATPase-like [Gastrolobium bilobum]|uniref:plasma membrane ATPase-like n=1 Tax=Gastrolobium bilobum TaxID=150636 RepID=UPI002AB26A3D|nr:plasma membrane ATPase-like [Gastrolobium bilobum]
MAFTTLLLDAGMNEVYSLNNDEIESLTLDELHIDINLIEVSAQGVEEGHIIFIVARAHRTVIQDVLIYMDFNGNQFLHQVNKETPNMVFPLCKCIEDVSRKVQAVLDKFAKRKL